MISESNWVHCYTQDAMVIHNLHNGFAYYFLVSLRQITSFSVAAFLVMSGFFVAFADAGKDGKIGWGFILNRIKWLIIPYTLWSIVIFIQLFLVDHRQFTLWEVPLKFLTTGPDGPYYYVPLLCYFYLLSKILAPAAMKHPRLLLWVTGLIQVGSMGLRYLQLSGVQGDFFSILRDLTPDWSIFRWIFFFALGLVVGYHLEKCKQWLIRWHKRLLAVSLVFAIMGILEPEVIYRGAGIDWRWMPFPYSTQIYAVAVILFMLGTPLEKFRISKVLGKLNKNTFGIYLLHYKSMEVFSRLLYHVLPALMPMTLLVFPMTFLVGMGLPLGFMWIVRNSRLAFWSRYLFG